ncbi:hypothetical protein A8711_18815 [Micromonospora sp. II]|nr:hypothetical protein A8711_18815 [Micromonospora sp. II]
MAWTIGVARRGQQRSLFRIFQVLRVAIARSPRARIFAWARFTAFCRRDSFGRKRRRLNGVCTLPRAPW